MGHPSSITRPLVRVTGHEVTLVCEAGHPDARPRDYPALLPLDRRHYVVVEEIARGGMGRVLRARDRRLARDVAIKEMLVPAPGLLRRFEREARLTARLQHPAIVGVLEAGVGRGGQPFLVMPLVDGRPLGQVIQEARGLRERLRLVEVVRAVAEAVAYAHSRGVVHRDLKPSNVLVGARGEVVVIDWGLAKQLRPQDDWSQDETTEAGAILGTPGFMSPEQARGEAIDERADVYALGALLYQVLSGQAPAGGDPDVTAPIEKPRRLKAPRALRQVVEKAMHEDPGKRYATAREVAEALGGWRAQRVSRRPLLALVLLAVSLVLLRADPGWSGLFGV